MNHDGEIYLQDVIQEPRENSVEDIVCDKWNQGKQCTTRYYGGDIVYCGSKPCSTFICNAIEAKYCSPKVAFGEGTES